MSDRFSERTQTLNLKLFPLTPAREHKISEVLLKRQFDLTVVLENVHDPHNISAVLRSCDATGVQEIYAVNKSVPKPKKFGRKTSSGSARWVDVNYFMNIGMCMTSVKSRFTKIYALSSDHPGKSLHEVDLTGSVALLFGNEKEGLSKEIMQHADATLTIPMVGMVSSLNISVACAVTLYEAFRQRYAKGMYERKELLPDQMNIYKKWVLRELRKTRGMRREKVGDEY